jgi:Cysteine-rich CWC
VARQKGIEVSSDQSTTSSTEAAAAQKTCPVCGTRFGCMAERGACWCQELKLDSQALADLRARFTDCLCPRCLALAADRENRQPDAKNAPEAPPAN